MQQKGYTMAEVTHIGDTFPGLTESPFREFYEFYRQQHQPQQQVKQRHKINSAEISFFKPGHRPGYQDGELMPFLKACT
jgi:hypothetical protein